MEGSLGGRYEEKYLAKGFLDKLHIWVHYSLGTVCECEVVCRCCAVTCRCRCLQCNELRRQHHGVYCDHCNGFVNAAMCAPIYEWARTGIYPNIDFIHSNHPQPSTSGSDERTDTRSIPQASPNSQTESRTDESHTDESQTDDSLMFQMDDIDESPEVSTNRSAQPIISLAGHSSVTPNINVLSTGQSQVTDVPIRRNVPLLCSQVSHNTETQRHQRHAESDTETQRFQCNPNIILSQRTESDIETQRFQCNPNIILSQRTESDIETQRFQCNPNIILSQRTESDIETQLFQCNPNIILRQRTESYASEMQVPQDLPRRSLLSQITAISRPRATYAIEIPPLSNTLFASERTESHVREMPMPQGLPRCSRHNSNESVSKPEESQVTDCAWCKIPSPSNEYVSERTESHVSEIPIPQDVPGCSRYNLDEDVSKPEEPQITGASCMVSSSNEYYRDSLPSLPSTPSSDSLPSLPSTSSDDSPPSYFKVDSPTRRLSTSAPSIYDIPEPVPEPESLKQETLAAQSTSETSPASHLPELGTLRITDSADRVRTTSESSSSIEALPSDAPRTGNINGHPDLPSVCSTSASLHNTSVLNTPVQTESAKPSTSQASSTANRLKLPSPEMSKAARRRKSSESSIETLSKDPANETSEDEHTTDTSPKKDD